MAATSATIIAGAPVPPRARRRRARPAAGLMGVAHLHPISPADRSPVLPTLFMPGFPKSATSWLYKCLLDAFNPVAVGCGGRADGWSASKCGRRFGQWGGIQRAW